MVLLEIVAYSLVSARAARAGGADRIELCENASEGGTTPGLGTLEAAVALGLPVHAMIRPRGGDFLYEEDEVGVMEREVDLAVAAGARGLVLGALNPDATVDVELCRRLVDRARGLPVTFHRAFDLTADPARALEDVVRSGCRRLLTSGRAPSALEGADLIADLVRRAGADLVIMAGAGLSESNAAELVRRTGVRELHGSLGCARQSRMRVRPSSLGLGRPPTWEDDAVPAADPDRIRRTREALAQL